MNCFAHFSEDYQTALNTHTLGRAMELHETLDSTNAYLKRRCAAGDNPPGLAAAALTQTAGRGRLGRVWESRSGLGLYVSYLTPPLSGDLLPLVPIAMGLAAAETVTALSGAEAGIKWPNDIISRGRKLCGIFCEGTGGGAVCGIGVNLLQDADFFAGAGLPNATSLWLETGETLSAGILAAGIANRLEQRLDALAREGTAALLSDLRQNCVSLGRQVRAISPAGEIIGIAADIDAAGRLVIETEAGLLAVSSGEVQLRTPEGYV